MDQKAYEVNFDGIVGPTHNYGGLAYGNVASMRHGSTVSHPRAALFEGLKKMKLLSDLGLKQAVIPPHERPDFETLRRLGFHGNESAILERAARDAPEILASCYSSSGMWAANAATVSPGADTVDTRAHFTAANLVSQFHRSIEALFTSHILKAIFRDASAFAHHQPLPGSVHFSDEGAANHTRLCEDYGKPGLEFFVYGRRAFHGEDLRPTRFPARQSLEASAAIARLHGLDAAKCVFGRQNPHAIDAGVFHNDVIAVGNRNVLMYHELAYTDSEALLDELKRKFERLCNRELILIEVKESDVPVTDAVGTYLFNSQLVTVPDGSMRLVAPVESRENPRTASMVERIIAAYNPIEDAHFVDVRQSMQNGGGPACLRLRVVLTDRELALMHQGVLFSDDLYAELKQWGERYYREELHVGELADPGLAEESRAALDRLTHILQIGSVYSFQKTV